MNLFTRNPEFRRNLWLEFSPQRLFLMPMVILLALLVIGKFGARNDRTLPETILWLSLIGFGGLTIIWGSMQAGNALGHEFADGTWDSQRMSSLTPWQMTWGKLLGGTLYAWYGGGIFLLAALLAAAMQENGNFADVLRTVAGLTLLALLLQTLSVVRMLLPWQRTPGKAQGRGGVIGALILLWILGSLLFSLLLEGMERHSPSWFPSGILWYGMKPDAYLLLLTLFALTVWAVIGLWQLMRRELLLKNRPWWWLAFLLFWVFWGAGFVRDRTGWFVLFAACALLAWASVYLLIFCERKDQAFWIRFIAAWRRRDGASLQHLLPNWLVSLALALLLSLVALFLILALRKDGAAFYRGLLFLVSLLAFVLRDTAWILWLNLAPGARRADSAALISLAVAYGVLPWLGSSFFLPLPFLKNNWDIFSYSGIGPGAVKALAAHLAFTVAALWLLYARFHKTFLAER
jgi:hypothetical protein